MLKDNPAFRRAEGYLYGYRENVARLEALRSELDAEEKTHINIWLVDERLTTVSAHRALHEAGVSSRDFKTMVDQVAAVNILQYSLDALKAGQAVAGYLVHESPREDSHLQETIDGPVNETENLQ